MKLKLTLRKIRQTIFFTTILLLAGYVGYRVGTRRSVFPAEGTNLSTFWLVWQRLEEKYLDRGSLDSEKMIEGAIKGMVSSLGDPYTVFLPADDNQVTQENLSGSFGGVGIQLGFKKGQLAVVSPLKETPADQAGIKPGDLILNIKDEEKEVDQDTTNISLSGAVKLIRGEIGTEVILTLFREGGQEPFDVSLKRGEIIIPTTEVQWIERDGKRFAYIHLLQFNGRMEEEWLKWVTEVGKRDQEADFGGVILDLRNNPGGYLQGAVFVAGEFLPRGETVVWQENYQGKKAKLTTDRQGSLLYAPLVVLVNGGSASAAEILAGALQQHDRGFLVGQTTFGKGTVQEPQQLPSKDGLHITIAKWLLPDQASIHDRGVDPDLKVEVSENDETDLILEEGINKLLKNE